MAKGERTVRMSLADARRLVASGRDKTDWERVDAMTEEELEAAIAADPDEDLDGPHGPWFRGIPEPPRKEYIHIGIDEDIVTWFRAQGRGYQTRINAVLRAYYEAHRG